MEDAFTPDLRLGTIGPRFAEPAMSDLVFSNSLWASTAAAAPPTSALDSEVRADVAIIGGGYTGLPARLR